MKKVGITTSGNVMVEMTVQEFDALQQLTIGGVAEKSKLIKSPTSEGKNSQMNCKERLGYVLERLRKLGPKKKDGVIRSIEAMFQFQGGIDHGEVEKLVTTLVQQKFLSIDGEGRVAYANS